MRSIGKNCVQLLENLVNLIFYVRQFDNFTKCYNSLLEDKQTNKHCQLQRRNVFPHSLLFCQKSGQQKISNIRKNINMAH